METGSTSRPVIVLGYGAAAHSAIRALRDGGYAGPIVVASDVGCDSYSPVLTSYYVGGRIDRDRCRPWSEDEYGRMVDRMVADARVVAIDAEDHEVVLSDGRRMCYSKLLIATGAHPVAPGFPQCRGFEPHVLRTMRDAERLRNALESTPGADVLVSGTSMVGLKVVEACLDRGARTTLLGRSPRIMRNAAHPLVADRFGRMLEKRGLSLRLAQEVVSAEGEARADGADSGWKCAVRFDNGDVESFDEVVLAQGVKPNLPFADKRSFDIREGLVVDEFMRTSAPDVFAAGDVAQACDLTSGAKRIIGLWANAVQQGRCAGSAMAAELAGRLPSRPYPGSIPSNVIHVRDVLFASAGSVAEGESRRIAVHETTDELGLFVYETVGGAERLVGFNVLAAVGARCQGGFADNIGAYRRAVFNSYL